MKRLIPVGIYGLICGVSLTIYVRVLDLSQIIYNSSWGVYLGYLAILILPTCVFLSFREIQRKNQSLKFGQAMLSGLSVSLIAATIYSAYIFVDIHFFDAGHLKNLFDFTVNSMKKAGKSVGEIDTEIANMKIHYHSGKPYISTYIWYLLLGTFFSIVFFLLLRSSKSKINKNI